MTRRILLRTDSGEHLLEEDTAENEFELQELVKTHPELIPTSDLDVSGPLLIVGQETALPSGLVDLVGLARSGDLVIVEFKTGPQNSDFRRAIAQLLDYGSDLWQMSFDEFEQAVAVRYYASEHCTDKRFTGARSLMSACEALWSDFEPDEWSSLTEHLGDQLGEGSFRYVLAAQRFTPTIRDTIRYMNATMTQARFYGLEIVAFRSDTSRAYESRVVIGPDTTGPRPRSRVGVAELLEQITITDYQSALQRFFDAAVGLDVRISPGSAGLSLRLEVADLSTPLSIGWVFPPEVIGWMGLRDVSFGFSAEDIERLSPPARDTCHRYLDQLGEIPGMKTLKARGIEGFRASPDVFVESEQSLTNIVSEMVTGVSHVSEQ